MEDDDEFGDLYTDVLRPLQTLSAPPIQPSIDLNSQTHDSKSDPIFNLQNQTLASDSAKGSSPIPPQSSDSHVGFINSRQELAKNDPGASNSADIESGLLMIPRVSKTQLEKGSSLDQIPTGEDEIELNFDVEEEADDAVIPGVSSGALENQRKNTHLGMGGEASDDWDSDSEDDLQIVLNDDNPEPVLIGGGGEDGDPLLVAESEPGHHQLMEDQDWGEDAAGQTAEKELGGDAAKANGGGGGAVATKIGFSHQGYHPYHSQFKYVRPGAAPIPGAAPVGLAAAPGNVRPPMNAGLVAGRGRGDWWTTATRNASQMQKGLHPGFGGAGRGSGMGLDFTLPSHKPIFDVDIDSFEEKPWRLPGIDASEFFNFGFSEDSWKGYCKQLDQQRLEGTMQSKIRVYESGRLQQENDPDMPPELAAASGIRGITSENPNAEKVDAPQSDAGKGSPLVRPALPIGRPIQVEISSVERFPTMDTRQPRMRDLDAIIEIVLQDSADDDLRQENDDKEQPGNASSGEDSRGGHASSGDVAEEIVSRADGSPHPYNGRKRDFVGKRAPPGDSRHEDLPERDRTASSPKASAHYPDKDLECQREERQRKRTAGYRSPSMAEDEVSQEDSIESNGGKQKRHLSPSGNVKRVEELSVKEGNNLNGEMRRINRNPKLDANNRADESPPRNVKKQKLSSRLDQEQSSNQTREDAGRSRENSKPRSGSSRDHHKLRNSIDDEFVQHGGHHVSKESSRRSHTEDEQSLRRKGPDGRHDTEKQRLGTRDRESSYSHRDRDPRSSHYAHGRTEGGVDNRRKALESSERVWRPDEEPLRNKTLVEEMRRRERSDEVGAGHRNKARDGERRDDYGSSRDYHHKDLRLQHKERDVHAKSRYETLDDLHSNRRKEMEILRDADNIGRRKQERGDDVDIRKKDNHVKTREDSHHSVKQKGDALDPRKADDRHSMRHREDGRTREGSLSKPEKEGRQGAKSGRILDDRSRVSHAALKDKRSDRDHESKDTGRRSEKHKKSDPVEDGKENLKVKSDDRRSRQEKSSIRNDRAVNVSETNREPESKHKENVRKRKESEGGNQSSMVPSKKKQEGQSELATSKSTAEGQSNEKHQSSKKHKEEASSDDEQKDSRRGRSKLERWTSNEERDFSVGSKSSSSLKVIKEMDYDTAIIPLQSSDASKLGDESSAMVTETAENQNPSDDQNADAKSVDKHLDTVEKLKKRSERFKLPMPIEKEAVSGKKVDSEPPLPAVAGNDETVPELDVKQERPARKRRWISS